MVVSSVLALVAQPKCGESITKGAIFHFPRNEVPTAICTDHLSRIGRTAVGGHCVLDPTRVGHFEFQWLVKFRHC